MHEDANLIRYPSREAWLAARNDGIGGSEAAIVMGASTWGSPYSLWAQKTGLVEANRKDNPVLTFGRVVEPHIAEVYQQVTERKLIHLGDHTVRLHPRLRFMRATHDRIIEAIDDRGPGILSIKTGRWNKADEWVDEPPLAYQLQIQHELACSGLAWGSFAVLFWGEELKWLDVERHDAIIGELETEEADFWRRVVEGDPPPVDGSEHTEKALKAVHVKQVDDVTATLGEDALAWHETLVRCKEELKRLEAEKKDAENQLRAAIGTATSAALPGGIKYTYKLIHKNEYTVQAQDQRQLRQVLPSKRK
jgi:putative phage-type endonuclease